jgi:hypothetical protein
MNQDLAKATAAVVLPFSSLSITTGGSGA